MVGKGSVSLFRMSKVMACLKIDGDSGGGMPLGLLAQWTPMPHHTHTSFVLLQGNSKSPCTVAMV